MKYILELSSRTIETETLEQKHFRLITGLREIEGVWGISRDVDVLTPTFGTHFFALFKLTKRLGKGIKGEVMYRMRKMLEDHHSCDDRIFVEFNSDKIDFHKLINEIFELYINAFNAYSAKIYPEELIYAEKDIPFEVRSELNFRKSIDFFYPFHYIDNLLIERCFQYRAEDLVSNLTNEGVVVKRTSLGVFIISGDTSIDLHQSQVFNKSICSKLQLTLPIG